MQAVLKVDSPERALMKSVIARVFRPREWITTSAWADKYRVIPAGTSYMSGRWDSSLTPHLRGIMDACSDPEIDEVVIQKSSQGGGTETCTNFLMWAADVSPGPALVVFPTGDGAEEYNVDRFTPAVMQTPETRRRLRSGGNRRELKAMKVVFDRMTVHFAGSNSEAAVASKPIKYVICDEVSTPEFMPASLKLVKDRTKAWPGGKVVYVSKPRDEDEGINALYKQSDQRTYEVPCPHCGTFQKLKFAGIKWEGGRDADPAFVKRTAWYECAHCKGKIENRHRPDMMNAGIWVRKGERVSRDENGKPVVVGVPECPGTKAGFTFSSLYAVALPWGYAGALFVEQGPCREFINGALGEPYVQMGLAAEMNELKRLCVDVKQGGYKLATKLGPEGALPAQKITRLPPGIVALVGAIDLQRDRAYIEVRGFGERGRGSWLVWYDCVPCSVDQSDSLDVLSPLLGWGPGAGARFLDHEGVPMRVGAWAVDSGDGSRTKDVYTWINKPVGPRGETMGHVFPSKGFPNSAMTELYDMKIHVYAADPVKGTKAGRTVLFKVNVDRYKDFVLAQVKRASGLIDAAQDAAEASLRTQLEGKMLGGPGGDVVGGGGTMRFPADCGEAYLFQLTAEHQVPDVIKSGRNQGRRVLTWKIRPGRQDNNHYLDTCVLTHALADAQGVESLTLAVSKTRREQMAAKERADAEARQQAAGQPPAPPAAAAAPAPRRERSGAGSWMGDLV